MGRAPDAARTRGTRRRRRTTRGEGGHPTARGGSVKMHPIRITGLGTYLPQQMHTNETLPALDPPMAIADMNRIGVLRRGWASEAEGVAEMGVIAARRALEQARVDPATLDFI